MTEVTIMEQENGSFDVSVKITTNFLVSSWSKNVPTAADAIWYAKESIVPEDYRGISGWLRYRAAKRKMKALGAGEEA